MTSKMLAWAVQSRDIPRVAIGIKRCLQEGLSIDQCKDARGRSPLSVAAANGDMKIVKMLLDAGASVAYLREESVMLGAIERGEIDLVDLLLACGVHVPTTALAIAAAAGHVDVVEVLLATGAEINYVTKDSTTPLVMAATNGHVAVVDKLIKASAKIDTTANNHQCTALVVAAHRGHVAVVQRLLEEEPPAGDVLYSSSVSALVYALCLGHVEIVDLLLAKMEDTGDADSGDHVERTRRCLQRLLVRLHPKATVAWVPTPTQREKPVLICATENGRADIVEMLVSSGNEPLQKSWTLAGALLIAVRQGHTAIVDLLLSQEASVTTMTSAMPTTVMAALTAGHEAIVKKLIRRSMRIRAISCSLLLASEFGYIDIVEMLLNAGAEVDVTGVNHITALAYASMGGHAAIVEKLLDHGANPNPIPVTLFDRQPYYRHSPLIHASSRGYMVIVNMLLDAGATIHLTDGVGGTALIAAATSGHADVVKRLLAAGADAKDPKALVAAAKGGHEHVLDLLLEAGANPAHPVRLRCSALSLTEQNGHWGVVKKLLAAGATFRRRGAEGDVVFVAACRKGNLELVQTLLVAGVLSEDQSKAIEVAAEGNHVEVLELLASRGFDIASADALYFASSAGALSAVQLLIAHGFESSQLNEAVRDAAYAGHLDVVQELLKHGADARQAIRGAVWTRSGERVVQFLCSSPRVGVLDVANLLQPTLYTRCRGTITSLVASGADLDVDHGNYIKTDWVRAVISTNQPIKPLQSW